MLSCTVCRRTASSPANFLLTCAACAAGYHHRCHTPAVPDPVLVDLVRASTAIAKGTAPRDTPSLRSWKCAACSRAPVVDLTIDDPPPVQAPRTYNTAPAWVHKHHASPDPWDRLAAKPRPRRPRKQLVQKATQPFVFLAPLWLQNRRDEVSPYALYCNHSQIAFLEDFYLNTSCGRL